MTLALVVDDHLENLYLLRKLLQGHGFRVAEARHGAQALSMARQERPDLVISDLLMPVMDGYTLLRQWKADEALCSVPFVVYTATYTDPKDEALALNLGADAFVIKPAEPDIFVQAIHQLLEQTRSGALLPAHQPSADDEQTLQAYNATLIHKLEQKAAQLEQQVVERDAALRALGEREAQYRALVDHSSDMILLTTPDGRLHSANPAACRALGMTEAQICAGGRETIFDTADPRLSALLSARAVHGQAAGELTLIRADGSRLPVEASSSLYCDAKGVDRASLTLRDISERQRANAAQRELEGQLREAQKMQAVGTLAGGIAHDFNNIVAAILGYAALARADAGTTDKVAGYLTQIETAGRRARSLVQRILAFSRPQPTAVRNIALQTLIQETLAIVRATVPSVVSLDTRLPVAALHVLADATQLQQVLLNLCTNAWHALGGSTGRIEIGLASVHFDAAASPPVAELAWGDYAHLWVRDNGCGMDEATLARIFEPFFTTKPVGMGTGLGLAAVHGIVGAHRGGITVDSQIGGGSGFHVYLPSVDAEATTEAAAAEPIVAEGGGGHVLYVDDDTTLVLLAELMLGRAGYRVSSFVDARQALAAVAAAPNDFDLVVTDFNMPELSGLDVAAELRAIRADLPVILSSGHIDAVVHDGAQQLGVRGVLNKERMTEDLLALVRSVLATPAAGG